MNAGTAVCPLMKPDKDKQQKKSRTKCGCVVVTEATKRKTVHFPQHGRPAATVRQSHETTKEKLTIQGDASTETKRHNHII